MARKPKGRRRRNDDAGKHTLLHLNFSNKDLADSSRYPKKVCDSKSLNPLAKSYKVSISGNRFYIAEPNGGSPEQLPIVTLYKNLTYEFDFSDSSMVGNVFRLSTEVDGTHEGGDQYTNGWTEFGTPGNTDARAFFTVPSTVPSRLYYYDNNFDGVGGDGSSYLSFETLGQIGYSSGVYKSESSSADFSGNGFAFVSGYGYDHAGDLNLKSDFSLSFWMKAKQTGESIDQCLFDFGSLTGFLKSGDYVSVSMPTGDVGEVLDLRSDDDINVSGWNHYCIMRESGFLSFYVNGSGQGGPVSFTGKVFPTGNSTSGEYFSIGATRNYKDYYTGYIDDFFVHDVGVYGRDGFIPMQEDASGKYPSPSKDGLTAKFNNYNIYLISDGGYRTFEMYSTDSVNTKLPTTGNVIPKDNVDYANQYIYPFSGQDVIISFLKTPDILDPQNGTVKFYCDSGAGRELVANDKGLVPNRSMSTDANFSNVKLLLQSETSSGSVSFEDFSSSKRFLSGYGDVKHTTSQAKFENSSINFDGVGDYIAVGGNNNDFEFKNVDFTMEAWIKTTGREATTGIGSMSLISKSNDGDFYNGWLFNAFKSASSTGLVFSVGAGFADDPNNFCGGGNGITGGCPGGVVFHVTGVSTGLLDNSWHHVAVSKEDKIVRLFVDGSEVGEEHFSGQSLEVFSPSTSTTIQIGRKYGPVYEATYGDYYKGNIEEFRVTAGKARYTSNFTTPTTTFAKSSSSSSLGGDSLGTIRNYPRESYFSSKEGNSIEVTTDLRPQGWRYRTTGDTDVNGTHLVINNIQAGFTGTWTAEHWAGNSVFSTPRKVIIKDVIAGTGCVRPQITGFKAMGQIMALANPDLSYVSTSKPTWTGTCGGFDPAVGSIHSDYKNHTYKFPNGDSTGTATHYRIFSGWLDGDSLPSFDVISDTRYDGSTDNTNIKFIIREEPLGGIGTASHGESITKGTKNHNGKQFYKEMTFAEVSGTPVTSFNYLDPVTRNLVLTTGRLLISGDGNSSDDNGVYGQTCMYITAVDTVANDSCYLSNSVQKNVCFEKCPDVNDQILHVDDCSVFAPVSVCCSGACRSGYSQAGYDSVSECEAACASGCGSWPWKGTQAPVGNVEVREGGVLKFNATAKRGNVSWCSYAKEDWDANYPSKASEIIKCQKGSLKGTSHASAFELQFSTTVGDQTVFVPIYSYKDPNGTCNELKRLGSQVNVTVVNGGDASFTYPSAPINIQMKAGQVGRLNTNAEGPDPLMFKWYKGQNSTAISSLKRGQNNFNVGVISGSQCYHAKVWNGGSGYATNLYKSLDISEPICIECVEEKSQSQCCLTSTTRTFTITGSNSCKIASVKAYELWPDIMGNHANDYKNGRIIIPEVTSKSDKSWATKWHYKEGMVDGVCYNSGANPSESQNNQWCIIDSSGIEKCFVVSGCPDRIVYEITSHEDITDQAYSDYFKNSYRNKRLERTAFVEEAPAGKTGNLQVTYASSATYSVDCSCAAPRKLNLDFPSYVGAPRFLATVSGGGNGDFTPTGSRTDGTCPIAIGNSGGICWTSNLVGYYSHSFSGNWYTGVVEEVRGTGFNPAGNTSTNPHGAPDKGNYKISFANNLNEWDITVVPNREGLESTGKHNYITFYESGGASHSFVRTLKDNYINIRSGGKHEIISLESFVPATSGWTGSSSRDREVNLYTNTATQKLVFFINEVDYVDSNPLLGGTYNGGTASGYNRYQSNNTVASWAHQPGTSSPFFITAGWLNIYNGVTYSSYSGCAGGVPEGYDPSLACTANNVLSARNTSAANITNSSILDRNLDLWAVLETGDVLGIKITEYSGWNSYAHGKMLILDQPTGIWKNWTGAAQNPFFRTFVNGQEV